MSFLSLEFALFLAIACAVFHASPGTWRPWVLLGFSYALYLTWIPWHALLLLGLTVVVWRAGQAISAAATESAKFRITITIVALLVATLATFKWADAFSALADLGSPGASARVLMPLGLSYFVFKMIGYVLDLYWEKIEPRPDFVGPALFFSFFPQIFSGPIQRAGDFFGQFSQLHRTVAEGEMTAGLRRILFGLFKKIVVADRLAVLVSAVQADPSRCSSMELVLGAYAFALQLYADFSGITDIAIGAGLLFGIKAPENFRLPFLAPNIQEFWRRWHITLTSWLTDYLFQPLRMALRGWGAGGLAIAILATMLAVGVWHGSRATFAVFGLLNGVFMVVSVFTLKPRDAFARRHRWLQSTRRIFGPLVTFHLVAFALIFFRAGSLNAAFAYVEGLVPHAENPAHGIDWTRLDFSPAGFIGAVAALLAVEWIEWARRHPRWSPRLTQAPVALRWTVYYAGILAVVLSATLAQRFIYAQF